MSQTKKFSVTRVTGFEVYRVRYGYEWATFVINAGHDIGFDKREREWGELLIHSSYGSWAHVWANLGSPFKRWIAEGVECDYLASKLMGDKARVFDGKKTVKGLREHVCEARRENKFTKDAARIIWDWIAENEDDLASSDGAFVEQMGGALYECQLTNDRAATLFFEQPWEYLATELNPGFVQFHKELWAMFAEALAEELKAVKS